MGHCLEIYIYPGAVLPVVPLNFDVSSGHPGALDSAMGGTHYCDDNPTLDTSICTVVELPPLGVKVAGQKFQSDLLLGYQKVVH